MSNTEIEQRLQELEQRVDQMADAQKLQARLSGEHTRHIQTLFRRFKDAKGEYNNRIKKAEALLKELRQLGVMLDKLLNSALAVLRINAPIEEANDE